MILSQYKLFGNRGVFHETLRPTVYGFPTSSEQPQALKNILSSPAFIIKNGSSIKVCYKLNPAIIGLLPNIKIWELAEILLLN